MFLSLNSYPILILFGLFKRARAYALNFLVDFNNFSYQLTYDPIKALCPQFTRKASPSYPISILFRLFERARACA